MKKAFTTILMVAVLAVMALGYNSTPVLTIPPSEPGHPNVIGRKTVYIGNDATFSIDVEDSNDDTVTVTAQGGTVTKRASVYAGDTTITDANGTYVFHIYKTTYDLKFRPVVTGYQYPEIVVTDSLGLRDVKYVELDVRKKNIQPVITGCRAN
jgi:hypothetical protein